MPAPAQNEKFLIAFDIEMEMRRASRKVSDFQKQLQKLTMLPKRFQTAEKKALRELDKGLRTSTGTVKQLQRALIDAGKDQTEFGKKARQQAALTEKSFDMVREASNQLRQTIRKNLEKVSDLEKKVRAASDKDEKKKLEAQLDRIKERAKAEISQQRQIYSKKRNELTKSLKESGSVSTIEQQQKSARKQAAEFKKHREAALASGSDARGAVAIAAAKMKPEGGKGGGGMEAAIAGMVKGLGSIGGTLKSVLGSFSSLAPLIAGVTGGLAGIVTLMIDAEASAKELNKTILQASGTGNYFARNMGKGAVALEDMQQTMAAIRNDATSLDNISWGIKKEDHMAFVSQLAHEGVAVDNFGEQFETMGKKSELAAAHARSYGGVVQMAVAYSRQFGVSLAELTTFQSEMMTEMGSGLADVEKQFAMMSRVAGESGIAQNKFFNIIRGVSSDLALYNSRLEDSYKILGLIGKVMSPRNAQKFMQTAMQGLKGMSNVDRLHLNIMSGGKGGAAVKKDLQRKSSDLASKISSAGGNVSAADILDSNKTTADLLKGVPKEMEGEFRDAILSMRTDQSMNKKGLYGASAAMKNLSPAAAIEMQKAALKPFMGGAKTIAEARGNLGFEEMAKSRGISEDTLDAWVKFEAAIEDQKNALKQRSGADAKKIDAMTDDEVLDTMDKSLKEELTNSAKVIDYNKRTSELTSTINDKIQALVEFLMNQLYNAMLGIWEIIADIASSKLFDPTGAKAEERRRTKLEVAVNKTKNKELIDLLGNSKSVDEFRKKAFETSGAKDMESTIYGNEKISSDLNKQLEDLGAKINKTSDPAEKAKLEAEYKNVLGKRDAQAEKYNAALRVIDTQVGGAGKDGSLKADRLIDAAAMAGVSLSGNKGAKARESLESGKDLATAMKDAGFSADEQAKILDKIRLQMSPEQLAKAIGDYQGMTNGASGTSASSAAAATGGGGAPATAGGGGGGVAVPKPPPQAEGDAKQGEEIIKGTEGVHQALRQDGIKIDKSFLSNNYEKSVYSAVLDAMREALFEFALYTAKDPGQLLSRMQGSGFKAGSLAAAFAADPKNAQFLKGNAVGGEVVGIANGQAVVASPGEGLASIGKGERIVPAGGSRGGDSFQINVNGIGGPDLARYLQQRVSEIVYEYKRREKFS